MGIVKTFNCIFTQLGARLRNSVNNFDFLMNDANFPILSFKPNCQSLKAI